MTPTATARKIFESINALDVHTLSADERKQLGTAALELQQKVELPWDTLHRLVWVEPVLAACLKIFIDLKLFEKWVAAGGGAKTSVELGSMVHADPALIVRLMRVVVALGLAQAPAPHLYAMSGFTRSLASPTQSAAIRYMWALQLPTCQALPTFLNENGYENPNNPEALTAFNRSKGTENRLFDYLRSHLDEQKDFASCMIGYAGNLTPWTSIFPTEQLLGCDTDNVLVVDVGGGVGHDLLHIAEKHSLPATRLILQDLTEVVSAVKGSDKFRVLAHDFFTPQPVKGACTYYLHSVLHDWPDAQAVQILSQIKEAMDKKKSRILVHDIILQPQMNAPLAAQSDILMMAAFNAAERTEEMWKNLFDLVGLQIVDVYSHSSSPQKIIELRLA